MNHKTIFLDKVFWGRIWPSLMGCISQGMTTSISLIIIWWLNGSLEVIFEAAVVRQIIILSVVTNVLINGGILLLEILYAWKVANLFLIPIDSSINFRGIKDHVDISQEGEAYVRYGLPYCITFLECYNFSYSLHFAGKMDNCAFKFYCSYLAISCSRFNASYN